MPGLHELLILVGWAQGLGGFLCKFSELIPSCSPYTTCELTGERGKEEAEAGSWALGVLPVLMWALGGW